MDRFGIPTTRKIGGIYTIDLIRELEKELESVPRKQIDAGLDYLIEGARRIRGK